MDIAAYLYLLASFSIFFVIKFKLLRKSSNFLLLRVTLTSCLMLASKKR